MITKFGFFISVDIKNLRLFYVSYVEWLVICLIDISVAMLVLGL